MSSAALFDDEASLGDHDRARVSAARSCALRALSAYDPPLCDAREEDVVMVAHANNYVFRVDLRAAAAAAAAAATDTEGAVEQAGAPDFVAVRVSGDASVRGEGEVKAEMAWLAAIARDAPLPDGVRVVTPHAASDGRLVVAAPWKPSADAGAEDAAAAAAAAGTGSAVRYCVVFDWMEGVAFRVDVPVPRVFAVGALMAHLHNHADAIAAAGGIPSQDALPRLNSLWLFSPPPALRAAGSEAGAAEGTGVELPAELVDAAARAAAAAQSSMSALWEEGGSAAERLIHADLHFGNVLVKRGDEALQLIDFDDCLRGLPIQDLGISLFYQRFNGPGGMISGEIAEDAAARRDALLRGYASVRDLPRGVSVPASTDRDGVWGDGAALDAVVAMRELQLLGYISNSSTGALASAAPAFCKAACERLASWLAMHEPAS